MIMKRGKKKATEETPGPSTESCDPTAGVRQPKIGLALGSGVARGWAHIGVLKAMEAAGIKPDVIAGTSSGAVVGGAYASGSLDVLEKWTRELSPIGFFRFLDFKLRGGGLFGGQKFNELMEMSFGSKNIEDLDLPFVAIATELATGHEVWLREGKMIDALQASFALPGVFEPVCQDGQWLVDGALVNPVPVSVCRALGAELVIAVNLSEDIYGRARAAREGVATTGQYGVFDDSVSASMGGRRGSPDFLKRIFLHQKQQPSIFANMVASLNIMQNRLSRSRLAGDPADVMVVPRVGHIGLMEFHRADELITAGEEAYARSADYIEDAISIIGHRMNAG